MADKAAIVLWLGGVGWLVAVGLVTTRMALDSLSGGTIRKLELKSRELAERLEGWVERRDELRTAIRLLLLLVLFALAYCFHVWCVVCEQAEQSLWMLLLPPATGAILFLVVTEWLGRHLPGLTTGRYLALAVPAVRVLGYLVFPLLMPFILWHRWAERWHETHAEEEKATAEDEIMSLVEKDEQEGEEDAALEADERRMIRGILHLDETLVHEIMTPRVDVDAVEDTVTLADVKAQIIESGHSRIPVFRDTVDHITGVVYAKDLLNDERLADMQGIGDLFHRPVFIPETKNIGDLLEEFQQNRNHFAVVLDEYGGTAGIVTFEDILEEIVGEIQDEYDENEEQPTRQMLPDGSAVVDARIAVDELNDMLDAELPEDQDFDTLGGYISAACGRIPQAGDILKTEHLTLEILSADPRRVLKAKVKPRPAGSANGVPEND